MQEKVGYNEKNTINEDEINLRDFLNLVIKVVIKRKKLILTIFFITVITAAMVNLITPKVYQATTTIMITPSKIETVLQPSQVALDIHQKEIDARRPPAISIPTHKALLKSNVVLERIIDELKLTDNSGKSLSVDILSKRLNIEEKKDTNILQLKAEDSNPQKAKELVNTWAQIYVKFIQELISGEIKDAGDFITEQFAIAKENLALAEQKVNAFKNKYKIDLMQTELDIKKEKLNAYKKELVDSKITLKTEEYKLVELKFIKIWKPVS
ncbi:MAG: Wzz/FepE/Etk N-terminal domain-containing protein [Candidatus Omnitrophica bacterium]|nr:Wzz/FepE/Etk N-terminal domain-containing protein [Candidatus Omnitrophota bacterium]